MRAYSRDLRERVLAEGDEGRSTREVADRFSVSPAWVRRLKQRRRESGETGPRRGKTGPPAKLADQQQALVQLVEEQPDATLEEWRGKLPVAVSLTTLGRGLKALGITLKKSNPCGGATAPGRARPASELDLLAGASRSAAVGLHR